MGHIKTLMAYKEFLDKELGVVRVSVRRNATRMTGGWEKGHCLIIVPYGVSSAMIAKGIEQMKPGLLAHRPQAMFETGRPIELDGGITFHIERTSLFHDKLVLHPRLDGGVLTIGSEVDMADPQAVGIISRLLIRGAYPIARRLLIPQAERRACELGLSHNGISISRGHKVLGHCSSRREIAISAVCLFLPQELRDYIYCHELAHLTEMNHSARFHALCDTYLQGRERQLIAKLKSYQWPILR